MIFLVSRAFRVINKQITTNMASNRATKSGFAAEAQRKVSMQAKNLFLMYLCMFPRSPSDNWAGIAGKLLQSISLISRANCTSHQPSTCSAGIWVEQQPQGGTLWPCIRATISIYAQGAWNLMLCLSFVDLYVAHGAVWSHKWLTWFSVHSTKISKSSQVGAV